MIRYTRPWASLTCLFVLLWDLSAQLQAGTIVKRMEITNPRSFGHFIGDLLHQKIELELASPYLLDQGSLPEAGLLSRGLELRTPMVRSRYSGGTTSYEIVLTYQTFYLAQRLESIVIPSLELSAGNGERVLPLRVPEWEFSITPLTEQGGNASAAIAGLLRSDQRPPAIPLTAQLYRLIGLSFCLLATLLYLTYARWGIHFLARRSRPFSMAFRRLKKLERRPFTNALYLEALRSVHRAFDLTAGRTVMAGNLESFFVDHPEFAALRTRIETLFMRSRTVFFEPRRQAATDAVSLQQLLQLCHRCRAVERGIP